MNYGKFRSIQEPARVQSAYRNEVSPILAPVSDIGRSGRRAERPVGRSDAAVGSGYTLPRTGGRHDYDTCLTPVFRGWRSRYDLHRLNRIHRNLIRERLAVLVGIR